MSGLRAGSLRHRITIEEPIIEDGAFQKQSWRVYRENVPAKVTFLSVKEQVASGAEVSKVSARIQMRYDKNINAKMRIRFRDDLFEIEGITPDNRTGLEWMTVFVIQVTRDSS